MKVAIKTLGCRLNQAETQEIIDELKSKGIEIVSFRKPADLYLINSCAVTNLANFKSRQVIHFIRNRYPQAKIFLTGCAKNLKKEKIDLFLENKKEIPKMIFKTLQNIKTQKEVRKSKENSKNLNKHNAASKKRTEQKKVIWQNDNDCFRTRAFIKVQEGCNNFCSYCIVPYLRGKPKSVPAQEVINRIIKKVKEGYKEVVLSGVNLGKYEDESETKSGKYHKERINLVSLLKMILSKTEILRIRLGSINPEDVSLEFIKLFENPRLCHHLHLSLQSGSDAVLRRMNRRYDTAEYEKIVKEFYQRYPDFNFTTDVIVGFPQESEEEFLKTYDFIKKVGFSKVHIFRYSKREHTLAAKMKGQVPEKIKLARAKKLEALNKILKENFLKKMEGKYEEVLFENQKNGFWQGFTKNYQKVKIKSKENLKNKILRIKLTRNIFA